MSRSIRVRDIVVTGSLILGPNAKIVKRSGNDYVESSITDLDVIFGEDVTLASTVSLGVSSNTIAEAEGSIVVTATIDEANSEDVVVSLGYSGTAVSGTDYEAPASSITITAGQLTGSTTLTATTDASLEAAETIVVDVTSVRLRENTQRQVVTIVDSEVVLVTIGVDEATIAEAAGVSVVTATLDKATYEDVTVSLGLTGTATQDTDYVASSDSITVTAGQTTGTATLTATADAAAESDETVIVSVTSVNGGGAAESGVQQQTVTITDANPVVTLSVDLATIAEAAGSCTLTATLDKVASEDVTVNLGYSGTATSGTDYETPASSITVTQGQLTGTTDITATTDVDLESHETIIVDVTSVSGGGASESGAQQQTITIVDDDGPAVVTLSVSTGSIAEAAGVSTITATLNKTTYEDVTVNLGYTGTAVSGTDYVSPASSITILQDALTGTTDITATADADVEAGETIIVDITSVSGGTVNENGTQQQIITITDDDAAVVTLSVDEATIAEAAGVSVVTATLDKATYENVVVSLGLTGTAISGQDYVASSGSITITAGQTTGTATLTATADANVEAGETIIVDITGVSGGSATESGAQQQTVTITDDDGALVTLSVSTGTIAESAGTSIVTATLDKAAYEDVTVSLGYSGTATAGTDYETPASSITIQQGQLSATTTLTATLDAAVEGPETIIVDITGVSGGSATESGAQQQTVTITDDTQSTYNAWIEANFTDPGIEIVTGDYTSRQYVYTPALVKDATGTNAKYAFDLLEDTGDADKRIGVMNVDITALTSGDPYGAGFRVANNVDVYMSNVTIDPGWPDWVDYPTTNYDGIDFDGNGNVYAENLTITNWNADAGIDIKGNHGEFVNMNISGKGHRAFRVWGSGDYYIVDSSISSSQGSTLLWFSINAAGANIYIYNSLFNGSPTCSLADIEFEDDVVVNIEYLTGDPRVAGNMHAMFD